MVLQRQQIRAEQRWEELGLAATAFIGRLGHPGTNTVTLHDQLHTGGTKGG